jgi:general secretion pathway protein I
LNARPAGFSLIEVLAALVIVSLGMLGVIEAVSQTAGNTSYLRDKTLAHWIAMNRVTELRLEPQAPKIDKTSNEVEMAGRRWRWTAQVTQTQLQSMRRIDVSVRLADAAEDSSLVSVTGFYGTSIAAPGTTIVLWQGVAGAGGEDETAAPTDTKKTPPPPEPDPEPQPQPETEE